MAFSELLNSHLFAAGIGGGHVDFLHSMVDSPYKISSTKQRDTDLDIVCDKAQAGEVDTELRRVIKQTLRRRSREQNLVDKPPLSRFKDKGIERSDTLRNGSVGRFAQGLSCPLGPLQLELRLQRCIRQSRQAPHYSATEIVTSELLSHVFQKPREVFTELLVLAATALGDDAVGPTAGQEPSDADCLARLALEILNRFTGFFRHSSLISLKTRMILLGSIATDLGRGSSSRAPEQNSGASDTENSSDRVEDSEDTEENIDRGVLSDQNSHGEAFLIVALRRALQRILIKACFGKVNKELDRRRAVLLWSHVKYDT